MKNLLIPFFVLFGLPFSSVAEIVPTPGKFDARIRVVEYNKFDVVTIRTYFGVSTHVQFGDGEIVDDKSVAMGDPKAWELVFSSDRKHIFLKPIADRADTNLTIITNKRSYQFTLMVDPRPLTETDAWRSSALTYALMFTYPEEIEKKAADKKRAAELEKKLGGSVTEKLQQESKESNYDYWVAGDQQATPTGARDDGRFTRFTFANNRDFPSIFAVDADGKESLVRKHVEGGNTIVVQSVGRKFVFRNGAFVACVVNKSFDFDGGTDNSTGTVSPDVERVLKEVAK